MNLVQRVKKTAKDFAARAILAASICTAGCGQQANDSCVYIVKVCYDAEGDDKKNINGEYITLGNSCKEEVDMTAWSVKDEARNVYEFPEFVIYGNAEVSVHSGTGDNNKTKLYWGNRLHPVWNNTGDTAYLRNELGGLVDEFSYYGEAK